MISCFYSLEKRQNLYLNGNFVVVNSLNVVLGGELKKKTLLRKRPPKDVRQTLNRTLNPVWTPHPTAIQLFSPFFLLTRTAAAQLIASHNTVVTYRHLCILSMVLFPFVRNLHEHDRSHADTTRHCPIFLPRHRRNSRSPVFIKRSSPTRPRLAVPTRVTDTWWWRWWW